MCACGTVFVNWQIFICLTCLKIQKKKKFNYFLFFELFTEKFNLIATYNNVFISKKVFGLVNFLIKIKKKSCRLFILFLVEHMMFDIRTCIELIIQ